MQPKVKANSVFTSRAGEDGKSIIFGSMGQDVFTVRIDDISLELQKRAMIHGIVQRVSDGAALGKGATIEQKVARARRIAEHLTSGTTEWEMRAAPSDGLDPIILAAVAEVRAIGIIEARELIISQAGKRGVTPKAFLEALGQAALVAPVVARIRASRAAAPAFDADEALNDLIAGEGSTET